MICNRLGLCVNEVLSGENAEKCCNHRAQCIVSSDRRSEIKCEEKKKKYILENNMKNHVISFRMDGGIIVADPSVPEKMSKCDYLYVIHSQEPSAILIELKGVDVPKALKQIQGFQRFLGEVCTCLWESYCCLFHTGFKGKSRICEPGKDVEKNISRKYKNSETAVQGKRCGLVKRKVMNTRIALEIRQMAG